MSEPFPPEGEVEGPTEPVPGGQPSGEPQPWVPQPGTYGSRNAGRRITMLEQIGSALVTRPILRDALEAADSEFQQALADGRALVDEAQQHVDDALGAVANAGSIMDTIQGTGADVVAKHTEVLTLHGQAITAASNAADDAALAAAKALEASDHAADALVLFEAQQAQIDAEQNARLDMHETMIDLMRQAQGSGLTAARGSIVAQNTSSKSDSNVSISSGNTASVTALGSWVGKVTVHAGWWTATDGSHYPSLLQEFPIPNAGSRTVSLSHPNGNRQWVRVDYEINPGTQQTRDLTGGAVTLPNGVWTTIPTHTWTVPAGATRISIYFKAWWGDATYWSDHGLRILMNGAVVASWGPKSGLGPLVGAGARYVAVDLNNANLQAGATVTFQAYGQHDNDWARNIRDTETRISWIAGA